MQANKASDKAKEQLAKWLQTPNADHNEITKGARADLDWLQHSSDLSSVSMDEKPPINSTSTRNSSRAELRKNDDDNSSSGGGFLALFGCASKRK